MLLKDLFGFTDDRIKRIVDASRVETDRLIVVTGAERERMKTDAGECLSRVLLVQNVTSPVTLCPPLRFTQLYEYLNDETWDAGVVLAQRVCEREGFPAYFAYLFAHELGHADIIQRDLSLHATACLVEGYANQLFRTRQWEAHELPQERLLDQFGIAVAERLYGRAQLEKELRLLRQDKSREDHTRLEAMLALNGVADLSALHERLEEFVAPFRSKLARVFADQRRMHADGLSLFNYSDYLSTG